MKLAQFYKDNKVYPGIIKDNVLKPIYSESIDNIIQKQRIPDADGIDIKLENIRFAPCVNNPSKIIALGLNYKDHAIEGKVELPESPLVFTKFSNSLTGHQENIIWSLSITKKVDFEAELAVIIGKKIKDCTEEKAMDSIFGYTCANDISARDLQFGDGQWVRGKSLDTFCPLGPWIVTADEIPDPHSLDITCTLNGSIMQSSNTNQMIFKLPKLISFLSHHFTLFPGDVILTGTPSGVGVFRNPSIFLKDGDEVIVEIEGIGKLSNKCKIII